MEYLIGVGLAVLVCAFCLLAGFDRDRVCYPMMLVVIARYSMAGEYGPASTDVRNFETFGGTIQAFWKTTWSPLLTVRSGHPSNITVGRDLYGTTLFNGRPGIATNPGKPGLIQTSYGLLDPCPTTGETILPRNYGRGPGSVELNLRFSKTIGFGSVKASAGTQFKIGKETQCRVSSITGLRTGITSPIASPI